MSRIQQLVGPLLDFEGDNAAVLVNNLDWTAPMSALDFLRDVGRHFRVNQMIRKEAVARRLESDQGISYTEFSYQMLQALDYLELYRSRGCTLQIGGSDQWGNITAGVDLVHRVEGAVGALRSRRRCSSTRRARKFGKSEGNAVWLSADMTSPYVFYQYFLNVEDASVVSMLKVLHGPHARGDRSSSSGRWRRSRSGGRRRRPWPPTSRPSCTVPTRRRRCRRPPRRSSARATSAGLDAATLGDATAELPGADVSVGTSVVDALVAVGLVDSRNARGARSGRAGPRSTT